MRSTWFSSTFLNFLKFPHIKDGGPNLLGGRNSAEWLNYLVPLLYFNFRTLKNPSSWSFIRFHCILHNSALHFSIYSTFLKGDLISWGEPIPQNGWFIWSPLLCFNFGNLKDPNSSSCIRFQCILHDWEVLFSIFWCVLKLKRGTFFLGGNQYCRTNELMGPFFSILILEIWRTQIVIH